LLLLFVVTAFIPDLLNREAGLRTGRPAPCM